MMIQPKKVPREGDSVVIKLVFDNGLSKTIYAKVRKGRAMDSKKMMHHQHSRHIKQLSRTNIWTMCIDK
jgi:copper(I)-binding protein